DLIHQQDGGENRPAFQVETTGLCIKDSCPHHIGWHQIRRKLETPESHADQLSQRLRHQRLRRAGDTFQQNVSSRKERHEEQIDALALSQQHLRGLIMQSLDDGLQQYACSIPRILIHQWMFLKNSSSSDMMVRSSASLTSRGPSDASRRQSCAPSTVESC